MNGLLKISTQFVLLYESCYLILDTKYMLLICVITLLFNCVLLDNANTGYTTPVLTLPPEVLPLVVKSITDDRRHLKVQKSGMELCLYPVISL